MALFYLLFPSKREEHRIKFTIKVLIHEISFRLIQKSEKGFIRVGGECFASFVPRFDKLFVSFENAKAIGRVMSPSFLSNGPRGVAANNLRKKLITFYLRSVCRSLHSNCQSSGS